MNSPNGTALATRQEVGSEMEQLDRSAAVMHPAASPALSFVANADAWWRIAKAVSQSGMTKERKPEAILAIMLKGQEIGVPPMAALAGIHFFDGKLSIGASTMLAVAIQKCGVSVEYVETTPDRVHLRFQRAGWKPVDSVWTKEDTARAGLGGKDNHKKYPEDMMVARATARGIRRVAPDLFAATYATEEVGSFAPVASVSSVDQDLDALNRELGLVEEVAVEEEGAVDALIRLATERAEQIPPTVAERIQQAIQARDHERIRAAIEWLEANTEAPVEIDHLPDSARI